MNRQITSITSGPRQSNFELLRILAMFMVLILHSDFYSLGAPNKEAFTDYPVAATFRSLFESFSIVAVNVFVMISGWFGIRTSFKGLCNFLFQCLYFILFLYIVMLATGNAHLSMKEILHCIIIGLDYWFIIAYLGLYLLAPILNYAVKSFTQKQFKLFLICFYIYQSVYGLIDPMNYFNSGGSTFSFIGLYMLSRYLNIYKPPYLMKKGCSIYITFGLLNTVYYIITANIGGHGSYLTTNYANPIIVAEATGLLLWFSQINIESNKIINAIAKSSFSIYLLHCNPYIMNDYFVKLILDIYNSYNSIFCLLIIISILIVIYFIATILDRPRISLWNLISKKIHIPNESIY